MKSITESKQWQALEQHWAEMENRNMRVLFEEDPGRFERMSLECCGMLLDYSKNRVTDRTMELLFELAESVDLKGWIRRMFAGDELNNTEHRPVLHTALRNRSNRPVFVDGEDVMPAVNEVLERMGNFANAVRTGEWRGYTGKRISDVVNIG
ncbi:MAG TPA: glucose-6-phosphate isomerase, partial [Sedimenticola sp.]|nr:glucose-6-phosphate isomerase [Sedimenticola sp.]